MMFNKIISILPKKKTHRAGDYLQGCLGVVKNSNVLAIDGGNTGWENVKGTANSTAQRGYFFQDSSFKIIKRNFDAKISDSYSFFFKYCVLGNISVCFITAKAIV